jgi:eukaryotic-like serine/threonine-protein kinase
MDPERWKTIESLYHAAVDLESNRRPAFLHAACQHDPALRREVESLLGYVDQADRMLAGRAQLPTEDQPAPTANTLQTGDVLAGRFCIVRLIGSGGMGQVYEAEDRVLDERIALKTSRPDVADQEQLRARLVQEVQAAKRIAHPGACRIHDLHLHLPSKEGGREITFLTMELLEGGTLAAHLCRTGPMDLGEAGVLATQLSNALSAAHAAGVIHRDLKPDNIVLAPSPEGKPRAVITDFGLARISRSAAVKGLTRTGQIIGTLAYMAPEQLLGAKITPAADIYAFGVVLYEMVTGSQPFGGGHRLAAAARRLNSGAPSPRALRPDLPAGWERAILRCLEREPANRFATATEVMQAIAAGA